MHAHMYGIYVIILKLPMFFQKTGVISPHIYKLKLQRYSVVGNILYCAGKQDRLYLKVCKNAICGVARGVLMLSLRFYFIALLHRINTIGNCNCTRTRVWYSSGHHVSDLGLKLSGPHTFFRYCNVC